MQMRSAMRSLHILPVSAMASRTIAFTLAIAVAGAVGVANAATTVGVGARVNCPGVYLPAGNGKICKAAPDFKDIFYLGENSSKPCALPYTRVNAGQSKWCVTYPD